MTCHSQIWTNAELLAPVRRSLADGVPLVWGRVNNLPAYVYFNHPIHIAKGVGQYAVAARGRHAVSRGIDGALQGSGPRSYGLLDMPPVTRQWRGRLEDAALMAREFPALASALGRPESRRRVLRMMAASMALGGIVGCGPSDSWVLLGSRATLPVHSPRPKRK
jgi:hypothetical protein